MVKDAIQFALSVLILIAFFFAAYFILADKITTTDTQALLLIGTAFGAVSSSASQVVSFWFGTTKSNADKDKAITSLTSGDTK